MQEPTQPEAAPASGSVGRAPSTSQSWVSPDAPTRVSGLTDAPAQPPGSANLPGTGFIEGYQIEKELHRGGQGIVYRAVQLGTKRTVALKILLEGPFAGETARRRFEREIELAASLDHANIVTILDSGRSQGRYFFAMDFVDGERLDRYLARVRAPLQRTLQLFCKVCDAVNYAHQRGVIHRDLKPSNILVDEQGEPHVLDFGLAKHARQIDPDQTTIQVLSTTGQIVGTVAYMSPEQARGEADVDVRSDVYSLGVVFYEALLGQHPYPVTGPLGDVLQHIANREPTPPRAIRNRARHGAIVNDELETILLKSLEKERSRRYQTAGELGRDLQRYLAGEAIEAKRASAGYMARKLLRRYKLPFALAAISLAGLIGILATFAYLYQREKEARRMADDLRESMREKAVAALRAEQGEREARKLAEEKSRVALAAQTGLQRALAQQRIERGNLARERGGLMEARDSYWEAYLDQPGPAAAWALEQYYLATGDHGAYMLHPGREGPVRVSAEQRLAAICERADAIALRDLESGTLRAWLPTPGPVTALALESAGRVLAAGEGWLQLWNKDAERPIVALTLPPGAPPESLALSVDGQTLYAVRGEQLDAYDSQTGRRLGQVVLGAQATGELVRAPDRDQLVLPTEGGLLLLDPDRSGTIAVRSAWNAVNAAPRAAQFVGGRALIFLADNVYSATWTDGALGPWNPMVYTLGRYDYMDVSKGGATVALGRSNGEIAVYERGSQMETWRTTLGQLDALWLDRARPAIQTLNRDGSVTTWAERKAAQTQTVLHDQPLRDWTQSTDGSAMAFVDARGHAYYYTPASGEPPLRVYAARLFTLAQTVGDPYTSLSADGQRLVVRAGTLLKLITFVDHGARAVERSFSYFGDPIEHLTLDQSGQLVALHTRNRAGDHNAVSFHRWENQEQIPANSRRASLSNLPMLGLPLAFVGSPIRDLAFIPGTSVLVLARSNGDLTQVDPSGGAALPDAGMRDVAQRAVPPRPWVVLDSPASRLTFDRAGARMAAICDDGVVRILDCQTGQVLARITADDDVKCVSFNSRGDILLVRRGDGRTTVHELNGGDPIGVAQGQVMGAEAPLALWVGPDDRLVINDRGRLFENRMQAVQELIEKNRPYARHRALQRMLAQDAFDDAWAAISAVQPADALFVEEERQRLLERMLRRPGMSARNEWVEALEGPITAAALLRLGRAAYDGEKFDLARSLLQRAAHLYPDGLDVVSARRLAECEFLAEQYQSAADQMASLLVQQGLLPEQRPLVELERVLALVLAGSTSEARSAVQKMTVPRSGDPGAMEARSALDIANFVAGLKSDSVLTASLNVLLDTFGGASLDYNDDPYFVRGELARTQGDLAAAALHYQRCIDLAQDAWPSNWARYRLLRMSQHRRGPL